LYPLISFPENVPNFEQIKTEKVVTSFCHRNKNIQ
jgi:hypothetical protein